jgi:repressor of nif and glnA expression
MIGKEDRQVERAKIAIMAILADSPGAVGGHIIARRLKNDYGIELSERAVRYHLKLLDERGFTNKVSRRDGRSITTQGLEELKNAMVIDKVGFVIDNIEELAYKTSFDIDRHSGKVPINISVFAENNFKTAQKEMTGAFKSELGVSHLVAVAVEGERLGDVLIPQGSTGLATVCSVVVNGTLLKAGIPMDSRFGGILQIRNHQPWRFTELIEYAGSSLDPSEIFITSRMTSVRGVFEKGDGKILANFREIPAMCVSKARMVFKKLTEAGMQGLIMMGEPGKPLCEMPVGRNRVGVVLIGGLNPVAAAAEAGIEVSNRAMSCLIEFKELKSFWEL